MKIFHQIAEEVDRFYERTVRAPDFVWVGTMEWGQMSQEMQKLGVPPPFWLFGHALNRIPGIEGIYSDASAFESHQFSYATRRRPGVSYKSFCEARLHEIMHGILLGSDLVPSRRVSFLIDYLDGEKADRNELQTLAAELVLFERLGLPSDKKVLNDLVEFAYDSLQTYGDEKGEAMASRRVQRLRSSKIVVTAAEKILGLLTKVASRG